MSVVLVIAGLDKTLTLGAYGLTQFVSGSAHYVADAQALVFVSLMFSAVVRSGGRLVRLGSAVLLLANTSLALSSGTWAVYLPFALVLVVLVVRFSLGLRRPLVDAGTILAMGISSAGLNAMLPEHPISIAFGRGATIDAQVRAASEYGGFTHRLRFWDQTFDIALTHPLGAGSGSYRPSFTRIRSTPWFGRQVLTTTKPKRWQLAGGLAFSYS